MKVREIVAGGASRVEYQGPAAEVPRDLARYIDHTLLRPDASAADIDTLCGEAIEHRFASVCVNPTWVRRCSRAPARQRGGGGLRGGLPLRCHARRTSRPSRRGGPSATAPARSTWSSTSAPSRAARTDLVREDIARVSDACHESGALNKVIIEAALLSDEEKVVACRLAQLARADMVKTSTGYAKGGATVFDVALMRETVGPRMGVKAAGGIRTAEDVQDMIAAGATRIGASAGVSIVSGEKKGVHGQY